MAVSNRCVWPSNSDDGRPRRRPGSRRRRVSVTRHTRLLQEVRPIQVSNVGLLFMLLLCCCKMQSTGNQWRFGVAVARWSRSTWLTYIGPG